MFDATHIVRRSLFVVRQKFPYMVCIRLPEGVQKEMGFPVHGTPLEWRNFLAIAIQPRATQRLLHPGLIYVALTGLGLFGTMVFSVIVHV
jgi:hypothetical protein